MTANEQKILSLELSRIVSDMRERLLSEIRDEIKKANREMYDTLVISAYSKMNRDSSQRRRSANDTKYQRRRSSR